MQPFLMGSEVEYSMAGWFPDRRLSAEECHVKLLDAIRARYPHMMDARNNTGVFLSNSMRYYLDRCDGSGHNELASPECWTPRQIAVYDRAGERILRQAVADVVRDVPDLMLVITKNNVNHIKPKGATWGQHESYVCRVEFGRAADQLVPHLISRLPYAGSGCLSAHPRGIGYELSQRAQHMKQVVGPETTFDRAVFCTRLRKANDLSPEGWRRAHLIAKDSQRSGLGNYLTFGVTGLMFLLINEGCALGDGLAVADPVEAMRTFSLDPWLQTRVPLADGRRMSALEIQEHYFRECEHYAARVALPAWTHEVLSLWQETLAALRDDPMRLARRLDTYLKLYILDEQLERVGLSWREFRDGQQLLARLRESCPAEVVHAVLNGRLDRLPSETRMAARELLEDDSGPRVDLGTLSFVVRMQALELKYHELGGFYDALVERGVVEVFADDEEEIALAMSQPPSGGRAELRGELIRRHAGEAEWLCDWSCIVHPIQDAYIGLEDPFSPRSNSRTLTQARTARGGLELAWVLQRRSRRRS